MKILSTKPHTGRLRSSIGVLHSLAICGAAVLSFATCTVASAQSGLLSGMSSPVRSAPTLGQQITHGNEAFRVVNASNFATAADAGVTTASHVDDAEDQSPTIQQVGFTKRRCNSCGTGCGGSCGGVRGYPNCVSYANFYGNNCDPCTPYWYVLGEALYMQRDGNERFSYSPNYNMGGFDYEFGARLTIGTVPDCVNGYEITYTGNFEWDMAGGVLDPNGNIGNFLVPEVPLTLADLSAFNTDVTASAQTYTADYWGLELNKTFVGWDVAKIVIGGRYIDYDEDYNYFSANANESGSFRSATENSMYGVQAGLDLLFPISRNGYTDFRSRIGGMLNHSESNVTLINDGTVHINNADDTTDLAGVFEIGGGVRFHLGEYFSLRAGAELWYLWGVATASEQFGPFVSPAFTGLAINKNDDVLITGVSVGAELRY